MAIFGQYTGARVSSLPSGFLGAAMQSAAQTQKGLSDIGETLGKAIEGYGRQKREDQERTQLAEALYNQVRGDDTEVSEIPESLVNERQAMSDAGNMVAKDRFTTEEKARLDERFNREKMDLFLAKRANQQALDEGQKQLNDLQTKLNRYNRQVSQGNRNPELLRAQRRARLDISELEPKVRVYSNMVNEAGTYLADLEKGHQEALGQIESRFKPDTSFIDEVYGNPAKYAQQKTIPGEVEEEAARRLGPKLIRKMEQGEMTKADELLLIDTLQNMKKEQAAARTPQSRLAEAQLGAFNKKQAQDEALAGAIQAMGNLPGSRIQLTPTGLTRENSSSILRQKMEAGLITPEQAIAADDAMVNSLKSYAPPQSGVPALPGVGQRTLKDWQNLGDTAVGNDPTFSDRQRPAGQAVPANPGQDYYNPEGYKSNRAFQRDYGQTYSDENQRRMWQIERSKYTINAPEDMPALPQAEPAQADPAPAAGVQPFMVDLPSRVDLSAEEKRQQALDFVNSQAGELGVAGLAAARAEVDRRFPQPLPNGLLPKQVTVGPDGRQSVVYTAPASAKSNIATPIIIKNPDGSFTRSGKAITPDGVEVEDPVATGAEKHDRELAVTSLGPDAYAFTKERADKIREMIANVQYADKQLLRLIEISKTKNPSEEFRLKLRGEATTISQFMKGRLREQLVGPGAMNAQEWQMLQDAMPNPVDIFRLDVTEQAALASVRFSLANVLNTQINSHIEGGLNSSKMPDWVLEINKDEQDYFSGRTASDPSKRRGPTNRVVSDDELNESLIPGRRLQKNK